MGYLYLIWTGSSIAVVLMLPTGRQEFIFSVTYFLKHDAAG